MLGNFWKISHTKVPFPAFSIEWLFKIYDYVLQILFYLDLHILCKLASFPCKYFFGSGKPMYVFFLTLSLCMYFLKKNTLSPPTKSSGPSLTTCDSLELGSNVLVKICEKFRSQSDFSFWFISCFLESQITIIASIVTTHKREQRDRDGNGSQQGQQGKKL